MRCRVKRVAWIVILLMGGCTYTGRTEFKLASLIRDGSIEGSFFLASGSFKGVNYYSGYVEFDSKRLAYVRMPVRDTFIIESGHKPPGVTLTFACTHCESDEVCALQASHSEREITIPPGSLLREFKL